MNAVGNFLQNTPPITLTLMAISFIMSIGTSLNLISPYALTLDWNGIIRHEYYRLLTGFLFFGPLNLSVFLFLF